MGEAKRRKQLDPVWGKSKKNSSEGDCIFMSCNALAPRDPILGYKANCPLSDEFRFFLFKARTATQDIFGLGENGCALIVRSTNNALSGDQVHLRWISGAIPLGNLLEILDEDADSCLEFIHFIEDGARHQRCWSNGWQPLLYLGLDGNILFSLIHVPSIRKSSPTSLLRTISEQEFKRIEKLSSQDLSAHFYEKLVQGG